MQFENKRERMWSFCFDAAKICMILTMLAVAMAAAWCDLKRRIIPNSLVFSGMALGVVLRVVTDILDGDPSDIFVMAAEVIVLFICLWPFYATGGLGAGDCKLLLLAGVFLPAEQAIFVVAGTFFIAALGIVVFREKKSLPLAPAFFAVVLLGAAWKFAGM